MLPKTDFLKILDQLLSNQNLLEKEKQRFKNIREKRAPLNEEITAAMLIDVLNLVNLNTVTDEDGYFKEFVKVIDQEGTITETEIFYLLKDKQVSCLHKLKTTETWYWLAGNPLFLFIFSENQVFEIILNADNPTYTISENTLFGAKIVSNNDGNFSWVTCKCTPGFVSEFYQNPSPNELNTLFKTYPDHQQIIHELTPKNKKLNASKNILQSIFQFFTCCIGVKKNEEQKSLINSPDNG